MKTPSMKELLESEISDMYAAEVSRGTMNERRADLLQKEALKRIRACFEADCELPFYTVNIPKETCRALLGSRFMSDFDRHVCLKEIRECVKTQIGSVDES